MSVKAVHPDYDLYLPQWKRCRDVVKGQDALHKAGIAYLPKLVGESETEYKARIARSDFFNATWRTISGLSGMAFGKDPISVLPASIEKFADNIDMAGVDLDAMAEEIVEELLEVGRCGLLVDHPFLPENVTALNQAQAETMGQRPSIKFYEAEHIRNWRFSNVRNQWVLTRVVLGETARIEVDEFEEKAEDRYRVLDLDETGFYRQRVFRVEDGKDILVEGPIYPLMNNKPMDYVPFAIIGRSGIGDDIDEPPLIDLVDANIAHYQVNADFRHGLHFTGLPTLFLSGIEPDEKAEPFYIGGSAAITSPHPDADGKFIEFTGKGLSEATGALTALERRMAVLGARMIADESKQAETLGATQIKRAGENSILARITIVASKALEWALDIMAQWTGTSGEVRYEINREFSPIAMNGQELTALVGAWQLGAISDMELFDMLKRGDIVDAAKTYEAHQEEIGQAGPAIAA